MQLQLIGGRVIVNILLALLIGACSNQSNVSKSQIAYPVDVGQVIQQDVPVFMDEIGNVNSLTTINVKPQINGILTEAHVKEGQEVKKGDLLYTIDPRFYEAQVKRAKGTLLKDIAALQFAQQRVERYKNLVKEDYVSKIQFEEYQSGVDAAKGQIAMDEADLALAEINLDYTKVTSPIDGYVSLFNADPGNYVRADSSDALTVIRQVDPADIRFNLTQSEFDALRNYSKAENQEFEVYTPDQPQNVKKGRVYFVDNNINLNTGTILFKGSVPNEDKYFWPGQFIRVRMLTEIKKNALLVPVSAVQVGQQGEYVYVVKPDNTVDLRVVKTGAKQGDNVVVEGNLAVGEIIVTDGQINLHSGAAVRIRTKSIEKDKKAS